VRTAVDFPMSGFDWGWARGQSSMFSGVEVRLVKASILEE
jgi:hypothetical protein